MPACQGLPPASYAKHTSARAKDAARANTLRWAPAAALACAQLPQAAAFTFTQYARISTASSAAEATVAVSATGLHQTLACLDALQLCGNFVLSTMGITNGSAVSVGTNLCEVKVTGATAELQTCLWHQADSVMSSDTQPLKNFAVVALAGTIFGLLAYHAYSANKRTIHSMFAAMAQSTQGQNPWEVDL